MENEKLLAKRVRITALIFVVIIAIVMTMAAKPVWNFLLQQHLYETGVNSYAELPPVEMGFFNWAMFLIIALTLGISYLLARAIFYILFINHIDIYQQAQIACRQKKIEKVLDEKFAFAENLIDQGFKGERVILISDGEDSIDIGIQYRINYFLKKFEEKIVIVDKKIDKNTVLISFKLK